MFSEIVVQERDKNGCTKSIRAVTREELLAQLEALGTPPKHSMEFIELEAKLDQLVRDSFGREDAPRKFSLAQQIEILQAEFRNLGQAYLEHSSDHHSPEWLTPLRQQIEVLQQQVKELRNENTALVRRHNNIQAEQEALGGMLNRMQAAAHWPTLGDAKIDDEQPAKPYALHPALDTKGPAVCYFCRAIDLGVTPKDAFTYINGRLVCLNCAQKYHSLNE